LGPAVEQVVPVYAGDDNISQAKGGNGFSQIGRLIEVEWIWPTMTDITKWTTAGALIAHDHEGGRPFAKALADVGAGGFLTDCVQPVLSQDRFDFYKARTR
jgi:hypothetical protein